MVQKALLCNASAYFTKPLNCGFKETSSRILRPPDCHLNTLHLFLYWLCNHELPGVRKLTEALPAGTEEKRSYATNQQLRLIRLWTFANRFLIRKLQNASMKVLLDWFANEAFVRAEAVALAGNLTSADSLLTNAVLGSFLLNYGTQSTHGQPKYNDDDMSLIGSTPGAMAKCFGRVSGLRCGKLRCTCHTSCYYIAESEFWKYMVPEE